MRKPKVTIEVIKMMEDRINELAVLYPYIVSREQRAAYLLSQKESWYTQTQEGEYLEWIAFGERKV